MILLDTNYLIGLMVKGSPQAGDVDGWMAAGKTFATSAIAWTEFLNGPVMPLEISRAEASCSPGLFLSAKKRRYWQPLCSTRPDVGAALALTA